MKKLFAAAISCLLLLSMAACGSPALSADTSIASSSPASSSEPAFSAGAPSVSSTITSQTSNPAVSQDHFVNTWLLAAIGQPLSVLEETYGNDYFIYEVGSLTGALEYYDPFICFYFDPWNYFNHS